jgi:hypothetical protein
MITARFAQCGLLTILLFPWGVANICQARIGDTLQEATKRYGRVVKKESADEFAMFKDASYYITAHFYDGKTDAIAYVKTGSGAKGAFSDREIEMLLRINGNGQTWERSKAKAGIYKWKTEDSRLEAAYSESKFLVITTVGYLKRLHEAEKKKKTATEENKHKPLSTSHKTGKTTHSPGKSPSPPEEHGE